MNMSCLRIPKLSDRWLYRRSRSRSRSRRMRPIYIIIFLTSAFIGALITFIVTFYTNSDNISDLITYMYSSNELYSKGSVDDRTTNYHPRFYDGKWSSVNYDEKIRYDDFSYLEPNSLTYEKRIYSSNIQVLFRFPMKTYLSALLLIFHSCDHTARDWFLTIEQQRIIGAAIDLGYGCLVFQAMNKINRCWSNDADIYRNVDVQMVLQGLDGFFEEYPILSNLIR
jgi:hypothetical protein